MRSELLRRYANAEEKYYMTLSEAIQLSQALADRVSSDNFKPDVIIGIANGALLPATVVADVLHKPVEFLQVRRKGSRLKKRLAKNQRVRHLVSRLYASRFFQPMLRWLMDRFNQLERSHSDVLPGKHRDQNILIVDDAIESGQTLDYVQQQLLQGAGQIHIAVISWSELYPRKQACLTPHYFISRRIHHYPWSNNSGHLTEYRQWLSSRGISEWN